MSTNDWLAQLKVGDVVVRSHGYGHRSESVERVERVTATQIILPHGEKYSRERGRLIGAGSRYASTEILPPTKERLEAIRRVRLAYTLSRVDWTKYPLSVLEQVNAVLESHKQKGDEG